MLVINFIKINFYINNFYNKYKYDIEEKIKIKKDNCKRKTWYKEIIINNQSCLGYILD